MAGIDAKAVDQSGGELVLTLNSGSSSLKLGLFRRGVKDEEPLLSGSADGIGRENGSLSLRTAEGVSLLEETHVLESQEQALEKLVTATRKYAEQLPVAVGHRIVHGGPKLREHQRLTPAVRTELELSIHFAPLHIPSALHLIDQSQSIFPNAVQIACFDTAFHRSLPDVACHLSLPMKYFDEGVFRYGFHGLSYESIVHRLTPTLPEKAVFAHLGNGSSLAAVRDGASIDTTMGFTPTGGIPMGTRSGDLDPGALLYIMRNESISPDDMERMLNRECGLAAFSGGESDMQQLLLRRKAGDSAARLAVDAYTTAVAKTIGAYAAVLSGIDLLVFTGGIGEHASEVRTQICEHLGFLGLSSGSADGAKVRILPAQEELQIARHCRRLLQA